MFLLVPGSVQINEPYRFITIHRDPSPGPSPPIHFHSDHHSHSLLTTQENSRNSKMVKSTPIESGVSKTPLVKKCDSVTSVQAKKAAIGKGMMFTFVHEDLDIKTYVTKDPVFDSVEGFQKNFGFLTEEMVDHMKEGVSKVHNDVDVSVYSFPLNEDLSFDLMYNYTSCMKECRGGEISGASMVTYADF